MRKQTIRTRALRTLGACALSAALLLAAGCVEDLGLSPASGAGDRTLGIEMEGGMTKVAVDDGTGDLSWTTGDQIAVRVTGTGVNEYKTSTVNVTDKTVTVTLSGDAEINHYSVYPDASKGVNNYGNPNMYVIYPLTYTVPSGLTKEEQDRWSPMPMVAKNTDAAQKPLTSLMFYHVGGVLRIKLTNVPTTATSCTVTFVGMDHVAGTYKVEYPGTVSANTDTRILGRGKTVTFNFAAGQATRWINVPLPTGDYSSLTAVEIASGGKSVTKAVKWFKMRHGQGRRIEDADLDNPVGPLSELNIGSLEDVTLWKGQTITRTAQACDDKGTVISGATITWASSNTTVATVDNTGKVTTNAAGTTTLTATASAGGVTKTASYKVYVNEITGLTLDRSSMTLRVGETGTLTATAIYTTYGDPEAPQVTWSVDPTGRVTFRTPTASGTTNIIRGATQGKGTITATIPAGTYGTNDEFVKTCSIEVVPRGVIPGAFSVSDTEQVYFAPGNLQVNYTGTSTGYTREWLFSENQWDVFYPTFEELQSLPNPPVGTTVKLSHFGWATAGHKNPAGNYGYDANHTMYEPHSYADAPDNYAPRGSSWQTVCSGDDYGNSWNKDVTMRSYCDWGIHFDDDGVGHDDKYDGDTWFTLSAAQWEYILGHREGAFKKMSKATLVVDPRTDEFIRGLVIVPDDWECPVGCTFNDFHMQTETSNDGFFRSNIYYVGTTWSMMEASGAVFLPAAGFRDAYSYRGKSYSPNDGRDVFSYVQYWSSSAAIVNDNYVSSVYQVYVTSYVNHQASYYGEDSRKNYGVSVRLVRRAN